MVVVVVGPTVVVLVDVVDVDVDVDVVVVGSVVVVVDVDGTEIDSVSPPPSLRTASAPTASAANSATVPPTMRRRRPKFGFLSSDIGVQRSHRERFYTVGLHIRAATFSPAFQRRSATEFTRSQSVQR